MNDEKKKDGGPAYPGTRYNLTDDGSEQIGENLWRVPGMSMRDYFAGMALQGLIASWTTDDTKNFKAQTDSERAGMFAFHAYKIADAMIAARKP